MSSATSSKSASKKQFRLQSTTHILSSIPANSILAHATNCFGTWGAGVALAIRDLFPNADEVYTAHCDSFRPSKDKWPSKEGLLGGVCLVPPQMEDHAASTKKTDDESEVEGVWIACLFTSYGFGRPTKKKAALDKKSAIWAQTESALSEFRVIIDKIEKGEIVVKKEEGMKVVMDVEKADGVGKKRKRKLDDEGRKDDEDETGTEGRVAAVVERKVKGRKMDIYSPQFNSGAFGIPWEKTKDLVEQVFADWDGNWYVLSPPK